MKLPVDLASASVRNVLKEKWLKQTDLTRNWHYSNVKFMRLELVVDQLTQATSTFFCLVADVRASGPGIGT